MQLKPETKEKSKEQKPANDSHTLYFTEEGKKINVTSQSELVQKSLPTKNTMIRQPQSIKKYP